jgi:primase-polymerase (primpol)-like protein
MIVATRKAPRWKRGPVSWSPRLEGYAEVSPSGTGVHVIVRGAAPNRQDGKVEAYSSGRYFTVTGRAISGHGLPPSERQEGLNMLAQKYLAGATETHVIARSRSPGAVRQEAGAYSRYSKR